MTTYLIRIEIQSPRDFHIFEKMLMSFCRNRCTKFELVIRVQDSAVHDNITMRCTRCDGKEERLISIDSIIQKPICLLSKNVCDIFACMAFGLFAIVLESAVEIVVCARVK